MKASRDHQNQPEINTECKKMICQTSLRKEKAKGSPWKLQIIKASKIESNWTPRKLRFRLFNLKAAIFKANSFKNSKISWNQKITIISFLAHPISHQIKESNQLEQVLRSRIRPVFLCLKNLDNPLPELPIWNTCRDWLSIRSLKFNFKEHLMTILRISTKHREGWEISGSINHKKM